MRFDIVGLGVLLAAGLLLAVAFIVWRTAWRLRHPPRRGYAWALAKGLPGEPSELRTPRTFVAWEVEHEGARLPVWDVRGDVAEGPVVVMTPGWGDSRVGGLARLPVIARSASRVVMWDPAGLGDSTSSRGRGEVKWSMGTDEHVALMRVLEEARAREEWGGRAVVLFGWSAGGGTSIVAGAMEEGQGLGVRGVIAEAPYREAWTPAFNVLRLAGMPWRVTGPITFGVLGARLGLGARWGGFDRAEHAARLRVPLLLIHGDADEVCPVEDSRGIREAARDAELVEIPGAGHNNVWTEEGHAERAGEALRAFLSRMR
ncbi:MAG: alpha/beta hydrolase family protein [Phycisphaerales bacterium]